MGFCDQNLFERQIPTDLKKIEAFSQTTDDSKKLRCETLCIADHEYVNISSFAVLGIKLWLEENGDLNRNDLLYSFRFVQSKAQN